jgi:hypothetical protein
VYTDDIDAAVSARAGELGELLAEMVERGERDRGLFALRPTVFNRNVRPST